MFQTTNQMWYLNLCDEIKDNNWSCIYICICDSTIIHNKWLLKKHGTHILSNTSNVQYNCVWRAPFSPFSSKPGPDSRAMAGAPLGAIENTELLEHLEPCPKAWLKSRKTGGFYVFRTLPTCKTTTWQKNGKVDSERNSPFPWCLGWSPAEGRYKLLVTVSTRLKI